MHSRQLIEVAGQLALRAAPLLRSDQRVGSDALSEYWIAARCRLNRWGADLRSLGHSRSAPPAGEGSELLMRLAEEVTLAEPHTRIVAALCHASDAVHGGDDATPVGRNALDAHRESLARLRALTFAWWPHESPRARHVRSLARQAEHWTDLLLAYVSLVADVDHLAFDASRLLEYAYDSQLHGAEASRGANQLLAYALRTSFAAATQPALNESLNRRIAGASLALFGSGGFDGHGLNKPAWMLRAERTADDTEALVDRLFLDDPPETIRAPTRWRI